MAAEAVGVEAFGIEPVAAIAAGAPWPARAERQVARAAARARGQCDLRRRRRRLAPEAQDAARGIAVQRGERPAQHFNAAERRPRHVRQLSLPVRHRRRDAVDVDAQPAHAEGRAGADPAHGQLQVLRQVLAIARVDAGDAPQQLRHLRARPCRHVAGVAPVERRRHRRIGGIGDDHHRRQRLWARAFDGAGRRRRLRPCARDSSKRQQAPRQHRNGCRPCPCAHSANGPCVSVLRRRRGHRLSFTRGRCAHRYTRSLQAAT
jgi:hypothetical protein